MKEFLLGIDIGSSALKMAIARTDGRIMASATGAYPTHVPRPGWAEQNPDDWWTAICAHLPGLFREAGIAASDIGAIGVDGYSWASVALDGQGRVLCNTPLWYDTRAVDECRAIRKVVTDDEVLRLSGNPIHPNYALPKAMWCRAHVPGAAAIRTLLSTNGYVVYRLTGERTQDVSQAYGYACYDVRQGTWDADMLARLPIDPTWLPPVVPSGAVVGGVSPLAARETGLAPGTPVVAGGLDAACGTLGAGVLEPGQTQEQGGQAGGISICTDTYTPTPGMILSHHVVPGRWLLQGGTVGGGGVMRWLAEMLYPTDHAGDGQGRFAGMDALAADVPPGADGLIFLPYMAGERSPLWNPGAKGVFFGLDYAKTRGHIVRAALEGVAYSLRHNIEAAGAPGDAISEMRSVGGAARSAVWMRIKADVTGRPIRPAGGDLATAKGALMLAGVGAGLLPDFDEAARRFTALEPPYLPDAANGPRYDEGYARYRRLYESLRDMMT